MDPTGRCNAVEAFRFLYRRTTTAMPRRPQIRRAAKQFPCSPCEFNRLPFLDALKRGTQSALNTFGIGWQSPVLQQKKRNGHQVF